MRSPAGEHCNRAGTSRDGVHGTQGATWTAEVVHLRVYASIWPAHPAAG